MTKRSITAQINKKREALIAAHENVKRQNRQLPDQSEKSSQEIQPVPAGYNPPPKADRPIGQQLIKCPLCASQVRENRIVAHLRRVHHITPPLPLDLLPQQLTSSKTPLPQPPPRAQPGEEISSAYIDTASVVTDETGRVVSYSIPKPARSSLQDAPVGPIDQKICEVCGIRFPAKFVATHYHNMHLLRRTSKPGIFQCILCEQMVQAQQVNSHRTTCNQATQSTQ